MTLLGSFPRWTLLWHVRSAERAQLSGCLPFKAGALERAYQLAVVCAVLSGCMAKTLQTIVICELMLSVMKC